MKHFLVLLACCSAMLVQARLNPSAAQMASPMPASSTADLALSDAPPIESPAPSGSQFNDQIQEAQTKWQLATKRKWLGYGIAVISSFVAIDQGPSTLSVAGYFAGGVLSLAGMIGEEVQKHRYSRAVARQFKNLQGDLIPSSGEAAPQIEFDFLIPPPAFRSCALDDLKSGSTVWFKQHGSPVLAIGKIESTSSRGSRVYVTVSSEGREQTLPMGDIYIPL